MTLIPLTLIIYKVDFWRR